MFLEIVVFKTEAEAQRYKDFSGDAAKMYSCDQGAEVVGRAGLGFQGFTDKPVWVVTVPQE
jgi:hypothetical protein